jgi:hypothetical protein
MDQQGLMHAKLSAILLYRGKEITYNGDPVTVVVISSSAGRDSDYATSVARTKIVFHSGEVSVPDPDEEVDLDGVVWFVESVKDNGLTLTIEFTRNIA